MDRIAETVRHVDERFDSLVARATPVVERRGSAGRMRGLATTFLLGATRVLA